MRTIFAPGRPVRPSSRWIGALFSLAAMVLLGPAPASAELDLSTLDEVYPTSLSGNYLAARFAGNSRDIDRAVAYYRNALAIDPENEHLIERTFSLLMANGDLEEGFEMAERLLQRDKGNRLARLALGAKALKERAYKSAQTHFKAASNGPLAELSGGLLNAWAIQGTGDTNAALGALKEMFGPEWYSVFRDFHSGLIADLGGDREAAQRYLGEAYQTDSHALRIVESNVRTLARAGKTEDALKRLDSLEERLPGHPIITRLRKTILEGNTPAPMITSVAGGAAEVFYGLGAAIGREGGQEIGAIYLQLARYLNPLADLATFSLATVFEEMKQYDRAIEILSEIPEESALKRDAEIQIGLNYNVLDLPEEANRHLGVLVDKDPTDLDAVRAYGNVLRSHKKFAEAAEIYSRGITTIATIENHHWRLFYYRGICYERTERWPLAEKDFLQALELEPEEPLVLNYLGYSWVDMGMHYERALGMIRDAVRLNPSDGYIVDSLGWAYYKLERYEEAVRELERAVELRPEDPIINDHLGDAYWRVGRKLEAQFQWSHARDLGPEPDDLEKIRRKLAGGLDAIAPTNADGDPQNSGQGG